LATYRSVIHFFRRQIWEARLDELPRAVALRYRLARIAQRAVHALVLGDTLHVRAAALTYFTVLSLVPLLAFAFALLKGFGVYQTLIEETVRPYALKMFSGNDALRHSLERILDFVGGTGVTSLGFLGLLALLYASTRLLRNIEGAFNEVWGVARGRELLQQMRDYVAIIVLVPLSLLAGAGLTAVGQALQLLRAAGDSVGLGWLLDSVLGIVGPLSVLFLGLLLLYKVMPYTQVNLGAAAVGAAVGAVLWYAVLIAHVRFQVGVARFNALYSSFAAIPIFLAWLQVSWLVVLVGAQIAAAYQNTRLLAQRLRLESADHVVKETIGLAAMLQIGEAFMSERSAPSAAELGASLDVHPPLLCEQLELLAKAGLLARLVPASEARYVLAQPAERVRLSQILDALRGTDSEPEERLAMARIGPVAIDLWRGFNEAAVHSPANRLLSEVLAENAGLLAATDEPVG